MRTREYIQKDCINLIQASYVAVCNNDKLYALITYYQATAIATLWNELHPRSKIYVMNVVCEALQDTLKIKEKSKQEKQMVLYTAYLDKICEYKGELEKC